ncbi:unnamed protein product [Macrosiphum euphorbiae]|uniref:C2H2-type domain-containing protein n=1 Tax=Macrosiphum euphorbiae TaxID=13131 RepID=A0AAV0XKL1_9HEMI|nr:unnamed protein product [Macrosiphum euphorbiae]CAI6369373.1 unnamed protein product [Macrosiphum euphorbiae]
MFKCNQCSSVFTAKHNLKIHQKKHVGLRFSCTFCPSTFSYRTGLNKHKKNFHGVVNVSAHHPAQPIATPIVRESVIKYAPSAIPPQGGIQIAPQIFVPDVPAGGSNMLTEDEMCMEAMNEYENEEVQDANTG